MTPPTIKAVIEISAWLESIYSKTLGFAAKAISSTIEAISAGGWGGVQPAFVTRILLPQSLTDPKKVATNCSALTSLPNGVSPFSNLTEQKIILNLIAELNEHFALDLDSSPNQTRMVEPKSAVSGSNCCFVVVGNSHGARTAASLKRQGQVVIEAILPAWRPTLGQIETLTNKAEEAMKEATKKHGNNICLVLEIFDNCFYFAQCDDGSLLPARKGHDGHYHVDGDLVLAPKEIQFSTFSKLIPLINKFDGVKKVLIPPLPRYVTASCCPDPDHIPNRNKPDFKTTLESAVYNCKTNLKDFAFRAGIRLIRVINPWGEIKRLSTVWEADPVHLTATCYDIIGRETVEAAADLGKKRKNSEDLGNLPKRPRPQGLQGTRGGLHHAPRGYLTGSHIPRGQNHRGGQWPRYRGTHGYHYPRPPFYRHF